MIDLLSLIESYGLFGVFISNILSSSILPIPSEPAMFFAAKFFNPLHILIFSLIGAMIGSCINYYIGYKGIRKLFMIFRRDIKNEKKAKAWIEKYGLWSLLIVQWIPIIGDPVMVLMGLYRTDFKKFLLFLFIGEFIKAFSVIYLGFYIFNGF